LEGEKILMTPIDSVITNPFTIRIDGNGTTNWNIKAWVGGINYKYFQYDHVGQGARQVGPFKPFVYATAIENS
jgi:penicillin-binding protein 1A